MCGACVCERVGSGGGGSGWGVVGWGGGGRGSRAAGLGSEGFSVSADCSSTPAVACLWPADRGPACRDCTAGGQACRQTDSRGPPVSEQPASADLPHAPFGRLQPLPGAWSDTHLKRMNLLCGAGWSKWAVASLNWTETCPFQVGEGQQAGLRGRYKPGRPSSARWAACCSLKGRTLAPDLALSRQPSLAPAACFLHHKSASVQAIAILCWPADVRLRHARHAACLPAVLPSRRWVGSIHKDEPSVQGVGLERLTIEFKCEGAVPDL